MHLKQAFTLALSLFSLVVVCISGEISDDQLSFQPVSQKNPNAVRKAPFLNDLLSEQYRLKRAHIIPDTLDDFVPSCYLHIIYASSHEIVGLGNKIKPSHTKNEPVVQILCSNAKVGKDSKSFTVALTDPDAPSKRDPEWSEMCHWIATVPNNGNSLEDSEIYWEESLHGVKEIVEYKPPGPPSKTGYHRYVFVLLEGDNTNLTAPSDRKHWGTGKERHGVRDWAEQEGLEVVGANFFYARDKKQ